MDALLQQEHVWVVDADLKSYFDTIPHQRLMELVEDQIADGGVLELIRSFLKQGVMDTHCHIEAGEEGTPQGAVMSPLLANIYLNPLDHEMVRHGFEIVRYADDFVVLCKTEEEARRAMSQIQQWVEAAGLTLHPEKTRIVDAGQRGGFDFLGYHFERGRKWPRKKSQQKLRDTARPITRRANGHSMTTIITRLNSVLRGWYGYFKHSVPSALIEVDSWIRRRLRNILYIRDGGRGIAVGVEISKRYPNTYFASLGLFCLEEAQRLEILSRKMRNSPTGKPDAGNPPVRFGGRGGE